MTEPSKAFRKPRDYKNRQKELVGGFDENGRIKIGGGLFDLKDAERLLSWLTDAVGYLKQQSEL